MKMELMGKLGKYDKEDWILFDYAQEQFEKLGRCTEKRGIGHRTLWLFGGR